MDSRELNKKAETSGDPSLEELEALFSGPPLDENSEDGEIDFKKLASDLGFPENADTADIIDYIAGTRPELFTMDDGLGGHGGSPFGFKSGAGSDFGRTLDANLSAMASGAAEIGARRAEAEQKAGRASAAARSSAVSRSESVPGPETSVPAEASESADSEITEIDPDSPEALRERIKAYDAAGRTDYSGIRAAGIVFTFGFTVVAVMLGFWWLGRKAAEFTGMGWLLYAGLFAGIFMGMFSGAVVLKPFLREQNAGLKKRLAEKEKAAVKNGSDKAEKTESATVEMNGDRL